MRLRQNELAKATALALSALALSGTARAQDEDIKALTKPESTVELGAGYVTDDNARFGQYTGLRRQGFYGIGNIDFVSRDDATGSWARIFGRDLGYQSRELRAEYLRQGNWGYFVGFSQTPAYSPYTINTGLIGHGTASQTVSPVGFHDIQPKTQRDALTLGFDKIFLENWSIELRFKNEDKTGWRMFGRGSSGQEFLTEPINSVTRQAEATLAYNGPQLQLSGGYYGTWFENRNHELSVFGGTNSSTTSIGSNFQTIGLPPDSSSYQFNLTGGYNFTPTTRATFQVATGSAKQTDGWPTGFFVSAAVPTTVPLAPGAPGNLDGRIDTTQWQLGLTSRPLDKLHIRADLRHEDRKDKTPIFLYFTGASPTSTSNGENEPRSIKSTLGTLEASYALPMGFRVIGGLDYVERERNASAVRIVSTRQKNDETSYRLELRRNLSESVNGSISYARSERGGSDWLITTVNNGTIGSNLLYPIFLADRDRDKWRGVLDWTPIDPLSLHFVAETADDRYTSKYVGMRDGSATLLSLDAAYTFAAGWQATAFLSRDETKSSLLTCRASTTASPLPDSLSFCPNTAANETWEARLKSGGYAAGIGFRGKPSERWDLSGDLQYFRDRAEQNINVLSPGALPAADFPTITYDRVTVRLFGTYLLDKASKVRLTLIYDRFKTNDWTWTNYVYGNGATPSSDGTTVRQESPQNVSFIGLSYIYSFR